MGSKHFFPEEVCPYGHWEQEFADSSNSYFKAHLEQVPLVFS